MWKLKNKQLGKACKPNHEDGLRLLSGDPVMHNGQWIGLDEWGRAAAALRVRPEAIEIRGGVCVLSTKTIVASMMENDSVYLKRGQCELCGMHVEEWVNFELNDGAFGTYDWVAPADDPLGVPAMRRPRPCAGRHSCQARRQGASRAASSGGRARPPHYAEPR